MYVIAKDIFMNTDSKYHLTRAQITAEEREIAAAQKDPRQFKPLYERYYERVLRFVYGRVTSKEEAYDITQQVFLAAIENLPKYKSVGVPFNAWLFRVASNELGKHYRKNNVRQSISIDDTQVADVLLEMGEENSAATDARLMKAIQQLEQEEADLLQMRFFDKVPFKDLADMLGITETAAKARVYRLLEKLKGIINALS
jgi:RNA polymerase sigma-70 factor (ECF subfamily)